MPSVLTSVTALLGSATLAVTLLATPAEASSSDLAGLWTLDEGSGQVARDYSFSGNRGMLGSTALADVHDPTWVSLPRLAWWLPRAALRFNGSQRVRVENAPSLEPDGVTVAARVRSTGPGTFGYVVAKGALSCDTASYGLYTGESGGLSFYVSDGSSYTLSEDAGSGLWDGRWHTVVGAFDGQSVRLVVDGTEVGSPVPAPLAIGYGLPDDQAFQLGDYSGPCGAAMGFVGDIDAAALVGHYDLGTGL